MIVPMKKIAVIVQAKDAQQSVDALRSLGVVHVEHETQPKGKDIAAYNDDIALINDAAGILLSFEPKKPAQKGPGEVSDWKSAARHIIDLYKRLEQLKEYSRSLMNRITEWERWGDFDPNTIKLLSEKNIYVRFYYIPVSEIKNLPAGISVKTVFVSSGIANCVIVSQGKVEIAFKEIAPPKTGLARMRLRLKEDAQVSGSIENELKKHAAYRDSLLAVKTSLEKELEFYEAVNGMGQEGSIAYLAGYVPYDTVEIVRQAAKNQRWAIAINDPSPDDNAPTLIRNPRIVSFVSPVFKLLEIVPGYHELDISLWFLIFFSIFFGMLIGDAGYGIFYLLLTLWAHRKWGKRLKGGSVFALFYILSSCAIIWGVLSGTFFGQGWIKPLVPALQNDKDMQALCFFLGAFHLSIAHLWRAILKSPSLAALADIGWVVILWGGFFLAKMLVLGSSFPGFAKWFFIAGPALVILFTSANRNILKGIGEGLGAFALSFINSFTDVVSYIRLFAVGLAGVAISEAFNKMALSIGFNSVITAAITSLILVAGHALNIVLGPLAVLVHGVRLNVLEFCSHVDVKWSGFAYKPLKEE